MKLSHKSILVAFFSVQLLSAIAYLGFMQPVMAQTDLLDLLEQDLSEENQTNLSPFLLDQAEDGDNGQDGKQGQDGQDGSAAIDDSNGMTRFSTNSQDGINANGQNGINANGQNGINANGQNGRNGADGLDGLSFDGENGQNNGNDGDGII